MVKTTLVFVPSESPACITSFSNLPNTKSLKKFLNLGQKTLPFLCLNLIWVDRSNWLDGCLRNPCSFFSRLFIHLSTSVLVSFYTTCSIIIKSLKLAKFLFLTAKNGLKRLKISSKSLKMFRSNFFCWGGLERSPGVIDFR